MNELEERKEKLQTLERRFRSGIESSSDKLEENLKTYVKVGAVVGATLFFGYRLVKSLSGKKKKAKKSGGDDRITTAATGALFSAKQRLFALAATLLYDEFKKYIIQGKEAVENTISEEEPS